MSSSKAFYYASSLVAVSAAAVFHQGSKSSCQGNIDETMTPASDSASSSRSSSRSSSYTGEGPLARVEGVAKDADVAPAVMGGPAIYAYNSRSLRLFRFRKM